MSPPLQLHVDGRQVRAPLRLATDVVIVGSGPAGATVARQLAQRGLAVVVLEEGHLAPSPPPASAAAAMPALYRDMGTSMALGNVPMPYLQGRAVGGTSVINGAISWAMPQAVHAGWLAADRALEVTLPWAELAAAERAIEQRLGVAPTDAAVAGEKNLRLARGAAALGLAHRPIRRNVRGCVGSGRCLQGCPHGAKLSMDRTMLPDAVAAGARIVAGARVARVLHDARGAYGVTGHLAGGGALEVRARHGVVLAASAIQTPLLLLASGLEDGVVGRGLMAHPGVSVTARFADRIDAGRGATQGHEVTGTMAEGFKIEALGFDAAILATRLPGAGLELARRVAEAERYAVWGAAIRAGGQGRVRRGPLGPLVTYDLTPDDLRVVGRAVRRLGELMFAAGAEEVYPGIHGFDPVVRDPARLAALGERALDGHAVQMSMTHLFATTRMGSDPRRTVVRPDFRHHRVAGLYVADSGVFPTNLGVNPQIAIMAMAWQCAAAVADQAR